MDIHRYIQKYTHKHTNTHTNAYRYQRPRLVAEEDVDAPELLRDEGGAHERAGDVGVAGLYAYIYYVYMYIYIYIYI